MRPHYTIRPTSVGLLARGKDYSVRDLGKTQAGYTNLVERELGVSLDGARGTTRYTQLHELSHVKHSKWTPERIAKVVKRKLGRKLPLEVILAAEDARISELLLRAVPDAHEGYRSESEPLRMDLTGYVASHAVPAEIKRAIRGAVSDDVAAKVDVKHAELSKASTRTLLSVWETTVPLAIWLQELLERKPSPSEESEPETSEDESDNDETAPTPTPEESEQDAGDESEESDESGPGESEESAPAPSTEAGDEPSADEPDAAEDDAEPEADAEEAAELAAEADEVLGEPDVDNANAARVCGRQHGDGDGKPDIPWIIPEVLEPELSVPIMSRGGNTAVRSSDTGSVLRWSGLHRMQTDGVVFRKTRRRPGALQRGTVLIDMSGSMSLSNETVEMLIDMLPHATIAGYRGAPHSGKAWIVVIARAGRRIDLAKDMPYGGGNMCDGPALLWLSRQQRPLVWVCDGYVTGDGDSTGRNMTAECEAIMQAAGIVQVTGYKTLAAYSRLTVQGCEDLTVDKVRAVLRDIEAGRIRGRR